jgi:hypothetical protein
MGSNQKNGHKVRILEASNFPCLKGSSASILHKMFAGFAVEGGSPMNKKTAPITITSSNTDSMSLQKSKSQPTSDSTESPSLNIHDGSSNFCCSLS